MPSVFLTRNPDLESGDRDFVSPDPELKTQLTWTNGSPYDRVSLLALLLLCS